MEEIPQMEKITTLSERLKEQMEEKGLTLSELGRLAHVDRSLMTKYTKVTANPKIETIRRLAGVLFVSPEWLEGYNVEKLPKPMQVSPLENDLIIGFRALNGEEKLAVLEYIKGRQNNGFTRLE